MCTRFLLLGLTVLLGCLPLAAQQSSQPFGSPVLVFEPGALRLGDAGTGFGSRLHPVGDLDGDCITELATVFKVPIPRAGQTDALDYRLTVLSGRTLERVWDCSETVAGHPQRADPAGDVDGDGVGDVGLTCTGVQGESFVIVSGRSGNTLGVRSTGLFSTTVSQHLTLAGDVDGDGRAELALGAFGATGRGSRCRRGRPADSGRIDLVRADLTGEPIVSRTGGRFFGGQVVPLGDADGDGLLELATYEVALRSLRGGGRIMLLAGANLGCLRERDCHLATGNTRLFPIGDLDGDGMRELLVAGLGSFVPQGAKHPGQVQILSGVDLTLLRMHSGSFSHDDLGARAGDLGDLDGDGSPDYFLSSEGLTPVDPRLPAERWTFVQVHSGRTGHQIAELGGRADPRDRVHDMVAVGDVDGDGQLECALGLGSYPVDGSPRGAVQLVSARMR